MKTAQDVTNDIGNWQTMGMTKEELVVLIAEDCLGWPYVYGERGSFCTPSVRRSRANSLDQSMPEEAAVIRRKCQVLNGSRSACTGCEFYPGGKTRCFDCRGFTYWVLLQVGITINGVGATSQYNDDNNWKAKGEIKDMPVNAVCCVFQHSSKTGKMEHTGLYVGNGQIIHCSGTVKRGNTSDKKWTHFAIPKGLDGDVPVPTPTTDKPTLRKGSTGEYVVECQNDLLQLGYDLSPYGADGKYGNKTVEAVKQFQRDHGLTVDGICGQKTWAALDAEVKPSPTTKLYTVHIPHLTEFQADALIQTYSGSWKTEE